MIRWNFILDTQPEDNALIIQAHHPHGFYGDSFLFPTIRVLTYKNYGKKWEDYLETIKQGTCKIPDWWWVYAKEFPFPFDFQPDRSKREDHASGCGTQNIGDKPMREVQ